MKDTGFSVSSLACRGFIKLDGFSETLTSKRGALKFIAPCQSSTIYVPH